MSDLCQLSSFGFPVATRHSCEARSWVVSVLECARSSTVVLTQLSTRLVPALSASIYHHSDIVLRNMYIIPCVLYWTGDTAAMLVALVRRFVRALCLNLSTSIRALCR